VAVTGGFVEVHFSPIFFASLARRPALLVVVFAALVTALIWGTVATLVAADRSRHFDDARTELRSAQRVMSAHVRRTVETADALLSAIDIWLTHKKDTSGPDPLDELAHLTVGMQGFVEEPLQIRLLDERGRVIAFGKQGTPGMDFSDREYFEQLLPAPVGTFYVGIPLVARDNQRELLPLALRAHANAFGVAVIVAGISIGDFRKAFGDFIGSAPGTSGIFRPDGTVLVQVPDPKNFTGKRIPGFDRERLARQYGTGGVIEHASVVDGGQRITAFTSLEPIPLYVYNSIHVDALLARWWPRALTFGLLGGLATTLALAMSAWIYALIRRNDHDAVRLTQALREAEAANRSKNDFMARMSHELRTPLNAILGFSEMIGDQRFEALAARHRDYARDIHRSGRHLLALIDQVLDIAKIESGVVQLNETEIDLAEFVDECLAVTKPLTAAKHLAVSREIDPSARALLADRRQLRQMLLNLLSNAAKFNRQDGRIDVLVSRQPEGLEITVADTGPGIPEAARAQVFEPFGRGGSQIAGRVEEGIGLGLPITKALVELHGGTIVIGDAPRGGAVVTLCFPPGRILPGDAGSSIAA